MTLSAAASTVGNPAANIGIFALFVVVTMIVVIRASKRNATRRGVLHRGSGVLRSAERHRDRGRLSVGGQLPRHRGRDRGVRLRRLPLLHRLPGGVARRAAAGRRIAAQHRQIHDGRRAELPAAAAAGPGGRRDVDADGVAVLPARPDGGRRRFGRLAARRQEPRRSVDRHRRRRRADDRLRPHRRHEGHHVGADHQGGPADRRRGPDDGDRAGQVRPQLLRHPRLGAAGDLECHHRGRRQARRAGAGRPIRRLVHLEDQLDLAGSGAGAGHRGTSARADAVLHRADGQGGPAFGGLGDRADRRVLPVHPRARLRRRGVGRARPRSSRRRAARIPPPRCWPSNSAVSSCSASSPRSRSRRSSRWSPD